MKRTITLFVMLGLPFFMYAQFPAALQDEFQTILEQYHTDSEATGISVAIRTEKELWASAIGLHAADSVLTPNSTFGMGSVSKTITSATILQMMEEGLLTLNDPISMYLDSITHVPGEVTIKQLLNHTSGIFNYTEHPDFFPTVLSNPAALFTEEDILRTYMTPPNFSPGAAWSYSNTNYFLLGLIIEAISGKKYYVEARNRFDFDTNYPSFSLPPDETGVAEMAHLFADIMGTGELVDVVELGAIFNSLFSSAGAAGAYAATPTDLTKWALDLYSGKILGSATMDSLFTTPPSFDLYGLGVIFYGELPCGQSIIGHNGGIGYQTESAYDPENGIAISIQTNDTETTIVASLLFDLFCAYDLFLESQQGVSSLHVLAGNLSPRGDLFVGSSSGSLTFDVASNTDWTVRSYDQWLSFSTTSGSNNGTVTIDFPESPDQQGRAAIITFETTDKLQKQDIFLIQTGYGFTCNWEIVALGTNTILVLDGEQYVRYGTADNFVIKKVASGTHCSNAVFGDPSAGAQNFCSICNESNFSNLPLLSSRLSNTTATTATTTNLGESYPNPALDLTTIPLFIPEEAQEAHLQISTTNGQLVEEIVITDRTFVKIEKEVHDWSQGVYFYSLIIDGQTIDTKRMTILHR